jgi:hypothetical protein
MHTHSPTPDASPAGIAGVYRVSGTNCMPAVLTDPFTIEDSGLGVVVRTNTSQFPDYVLKPVVDGSYSTTYCDAYECGGVDPGVVFYAYEQIAQTSPTEVQGSFAFRSERLPCTEGQCPAGLAETVVPCVLYGERVSTSRQ